MNFFNKKLKNDSNPVKLLDRDKDDKKSSVPISLSNKDTFINKNSLLQKEIYNSNKVSSNNSNVSLSQKIAIIEQEKNMLKLTLSHIIVENKDLKQKIDDQEFEVGFLLFPSNINEIKALADHDLIMPPKSTYIEPKFRSGLVIYEL